MSKGNLQPEDLDQLGQALITLTQELWVMKDRVRVLEAALAAAGVIAADTVDNFQPDAVLQETLGKERAQLIEQVLGALERQED
jgi:hypothetical protein